MNHPGSGLNHLPILEGKRPEYPFSLGLKQELKQLAVHIEQAEMLIQRAERQSEAEYILRRPTCHSHFSLATKRRTIHDELFECKSRGGARGVTKAELSGTLIQRTTSEAPQRRYVLHRT